MYLKLSKWKDDVDGYAVSTWEIRNEYKMQFGELKGRVHSGDLGVGTKLVLKWILEKHA
jgi:hypothetical protein